LCEREADGAICAVEVQGRNDSTLQLSPGQFPDWVELQNLGGTAVSGERIAVQIGNSDPWPLTGDGLEPGGRTRLWADGEELEGHVPASLSADGETVRVYVDGLLSDELEVPALGRDIAYGRYTDGIGPSCAPSPGALNGAALP